MMTLPLTTIRELDVVKGISEVPGSNSSQLRTLQTRNEKVRGRNEYSKDILIVVFIWEVMERISTLTKPRRNFRLCVFLQNCLRHIIGAQIKLQKRKLHQRNSCRSRSRFAWRMETRPLISRMYYLYSRLSRSNTLHRSCNLTTLSNDTLRPLNTFTRVPPVTEGVFARLEPMLKVFLASNNLNALPEALFNLPHVTVLSLRANEIQDLNPAIGRLKNLIELNLSQNRLQYLPYEILDLFSEDSNLQTFQIHPNPFHEPQLSTTADDKKNVIPRYPFRQNRPRRAAICGISPDQIRRRKVGSLDRVYD